MTPTVSVIIPTYNRCSYVQQAIDSVLAQTHTDYEIIVIDDGSTDGTGEALRERYGDRITYEWQENQGESVARNRGIALAQGEYIAFLDSDDLWLPEKLEKQVAYLEEHPDAGAVFAEAWIIDGLGQRVSDRRASTGITLDDLSLEGLCFEDCLLLPSTVVLRKALVAAAGGFDVEIHHGEDYEYFARVRLLGSFAHLAEPLACHRRHGDNQSYLSSEGSQAQLDTHLLAVSRVFDGWRESPEGLRDRVVAWNYARSAMVQGALG
ncbi:MAG: glycosyltransferase, partial [Chloroflexi bacterium]|nr:glycosyltransferase [Chloroflexota bacterium]